MSEEELKEVKEIIKRLYSGDGVTIGDILDTSSWLDKLVNEVEELQKEIKNGDERNYILGLDFIQIGEKLGLENFGTQAILLGIDKLQKEIKEYQELTDNLRGENAELRDDLDELKRDNETLCEMAFIRPMPLPYTTPVFTSTDAYVSKEKVKNIVNKFVEKLNDLLGE